MASTGEVLTLGRTLREEQRPRETQNDRERRRRPLGCGGLTSDLSPVSAFAVSGVGALRGAPAGDGRVAALRAGLRTGCGHGRRPSPMVADPPPLPPRPSPASPLTFLRRIGSGGAPSRRLHGHLWEDPATEEREVGVRGGRTAHLSYMGRRGVRGCMMAEDSHIHLSVSERSCRAATKVKRRSSKKQRSALI